MYRANISIVVLLSLLLPFYANSQLPERKEVGNLVVENIPEIPQRIIDRYNQYSNVRSASLADWEPSGNGLLIATRFGDTSQIHHVKSPESYRKQLTFFREPITDAYFSPRKDEYGFLFEMDEGGGEFDQLYWFDLKKGNWKLITDGGKSVNRNVVWSNSGNSAAFSGTNRNKRDFDIYIINSLDSSGVKLVKEVKGSWQPMDWSPDDLQVLLGEEISANEAYLYVMDPETGRTSEINSTNRSTKIAYGKAVFARDRNGVYYTSDEGSEFLRLTYCDLKSGSKQVLVDSDWDVDLVAVSLDGKWIAYTLNEGGVSRLFLAPINNIKVARQIDLPSGTISNIRFDRQSLRLGLNLSSAQSTSDVYSVDVQKGKVQRWTYSEVGGLNPETFVSPELIQYPTFDTVNGKRRMIPAFYYRPKGESKNPLPVVISIHGGPESQAKASFNSLYQYWVNELGIVVLVPNVRGSSGYGKSYLLLDNDYKREDSIKDIGKLLDWIATRPELDSRRVAVYGGSYGGFMVLSSLIHFGERIRCGVDSVGISNFVTFLQTTEDYRKDLRRVEYGDERDPKMREFLNSISPTTNANRIRSQLFVVQGKNDPRVPVTESEQMVKTVREQGEKVWYLMAKDEGHGFAKKPNKDFRDYATTLFFEEFLLK